MMQWFDVASASIAIACIGVVVAAIFAVLQLRDQNQTRQAQLFMEIYDQFYTPEFNQRWMRLVYTISDDEWIDPDGTPKWLRGEIDTFVEINALSCFFEGIGLLVFKKLIDIDLVAQLMSTPIVLTWNKINKHVSRTREMLGRPQVYEWFEYLNNRVQNIPSRRSQ
ncbi:MAG: hypothetical protein ACFFEE_01785 [Candidatus Thorarchaeota archaeon]